MQKFWILILAAGAMMPLAGSAAQAEECAGLSYRRNEIYKEAGYCFKTAAQIRRFGNAGCQYDDQNDVPLSARQREEIGELVKEERLMGCR